MKPFDPRLARYARATRAYLAATTACGVATAVLVIAQAGLLADVLTRGFLDRTGLGPLRVELGLLAGVVVARALLSYLQEAAAHRAAASVKAQLRRSLLDRVPALGPDWVADNKAGELSTLLSRGVDALDGYFARYLPQLVLSVVVPAAVLARILLADWESMAIVAVTLPLIPVFMVLIGLYTRRETERQWHLLRRLGGHFLDVVEGLPTLRVFGRAKAQVETIRSVGEAHRRATMRTLRTAFLSALTLELLSTLSVALVAVSVGLRLVAGHIGLHDALLVLLLAPEAYLPLRAVGTQFHASMEGVTAAQDVFDVLEARSPAAAGGALPVAGDSPLRLNGVTVLRDGRDGAVLDSVDLCVQPGERVALVGPSGAGKSTVLHLFLGFLRPDAGTVTVGGVDLAAADLDSWRSQVAWVGQSPYIFAGTIADNIRLGRPDATDDDVRRAAASADAASFIDGLADGYSTVVGERGVGLSAGQRQRVALARAFLRDAPVLLLDEPTAGLDAGSEAAVLDAVRRLMSGRTVLVVAHRPAVMAAADRVVTLAAGRVQLPVLEAAG